MRLARVETKRSIDIDTTIINSERNQEGNTQTGEREEDEGRKESDEFDLLLLEDGPEYPSHAQMGSLCRPQ